VTTPTPSGKRRSWDYPECPGCGSDVLVEKVPGMRLSGGFQCWGCKTYFDIE